MLNISHKLDNLFVFYFPGLFQKGKAFLLFISNWKKKKLSMFPKKEMEETVSSCTLAHLRERVCAGKKEKGKKKKRDLGNVIESGSI